MLWQADTSECCRSPLDEVTLAERGVLGDRVYAVVDVETGKVASAKSVRLFPGAQMPCAGVYAVVVAPGTVRAGDSVVVG